MKRAPWLALAAASLAILATARALTPAAGGLGTHRALGLPPCGFLAFTGLPCPGCGLTTAFAQLAHLQLEASLRAHPLGLPLFLALLALLPFSAHAAVRGRSFVEAVDARSLDRWALLLVLALLTSWVARLLG